MTEIVECRWIFLDMTIDENHVDASGHHFAFNIGNIEHIDEEKAKQNIY